MNPKERIAILRDREFVPPEFFVQTYGVTDWNRLDAEIVRWAKRATRSAYCQDKKRSRWVFEQFFRVTNSLTPSHAAFRLGMSLESLQSLLEHALKEWGLAADLIGDARVRVRADFVDDLRRQFPKLRGKTFSSHSDLCRAVHAALAAEGVVVEEALDPFSVQVEHGKMLASTIDIVTAGPLGKTHTVWLNFGKPIAFAPDQTSLVTYARYQTELHAFVPDYRPIDESKLAKAKSVLRI